MCSPPPTHDDKIAWYENLGGGAFGTQQVITTEADGAIACLPRTSTVTGTRCALCFLGTTTRSPGTRISGRG
jgi:hypothetical protein